MKNKLKIIGASLLSLLIPSVTFAAGLTIRTIFGGRGLANVETLPELITAVINLLLYFALGVSVLFVIIGGYWYLTSAVNEEQAEKGKKALINAIIGIVVIFMAFAIVSVIQNTIVSPYLYGN